MADRGDPLVDPSEHVAVVAAEGGLRVHPETDLVADHDARPVPGDERGATASASAKPS